VSPVDKGFCVWTEKKFSSLLECSRRELAEAAYSEGCQAGCQGENLRRRWPTPKLIAHGFSMCSIPDEELLPRRRRRNHKVFGVGGRRRRLH
jgi:hypothetical protein